MQVKRKRRAERGSQTSSLTASGEATTSPAFVRPVTASKSQACREGHTSGPCPSLSSAARPVGDVKSLKALHRYNVVKHQPLELSLFGNDRLLAAKDILLDLARRCFRQLGLSA